MEHSVQRTRQLITDAGTMEGIDMEMFNGQRPPAEMEGTMTFYLQNESAGTIGFNMYGIRKVDLMEYIMTLLRAALPTGTDVYLQCSRQRSGTAATNDFGVYQAGSSQKNTSTLHGNVGIGSTSPTSALDMNGALTVEGMAAPAASPAGDGRIYFDSTSHTFQVSQNGAAYATLATTGGAGTFSSDTVGVGAAATPSLNFTGDTTTGLYEGGAGVIGFSGAGSSLATLSSAGGLTLAGSEPFTTGTGAVSLDGATTIAANKGLTMSSGTGQFSQTYSGTGPAALITDTAAASGNILNLTTTSTAANNNDAGLDVAVSGANGTATVTSYGVESSVTATGATSTNVGGYFSASGATNNYGLLVPNGFVGIGTTAPNSLLNTYGGAITDSPPGNRYASTRWRGRSNTTAATAGTQQWSPRLHFIGQGWRRTSRPLPANHLTGS